jgi:MarR family transcriptional regulator, temperature-dependent positive regulator of motility
MVVFLVASLATSARMLKKKHTPPLISDRRASAFSGLLQIQFHLISRLSERQGEQQVRQLFGLGLRETRIIALVGSHGTLPVRFLSTEGNFDKGHASRLIAALVRRGLIHNEINPENQRANNLRLTSKGQILYRDIYKLACRTNDRWLAALPKNQHHALRRALSALTHLLCNSEFQDGSKRSRSVAAGRPGTARRSYSE